MSKSPTPLVYVEDSKPPYVKLASEIGDLTHDYDEADIIMFTGGSDVSPSLYGETELPKTIVNRRRDATEVSLYQRRLTYATKPVAFVGICRGGQFLNVMNGGKLWQDVDVHRKDHHVFDKKSGRVYKVSSNHHQMMQAPKGSVPHEILAVACTKEGEGFTKTPKFGPKSCVSTHDHIDIEAMWYPTSRSLCFQPHPEYDGYPQCTDLFMAYMDLLVIPSLKLGEAA